METESITATEKHREIGRGAASASASVRTGAVYSSRLEFASPFLKIVRTGTWDREDHLVHRSC